MSSRKKAIISLLILPPILMELMAANLPGFTFFHPILLMLLFLGYSLPVLVIREFIVRSKLGVLALFIMGLAYGILNEGLGAKTFFLVENLPVTTFDNYGYFLGLSFPWVAYTITIHAIGSVLMPIVFVHYVFPEVASIPWISKKNGFLLLALSLATSVLTFMKFSPVPADAVYLPVLLIIISCIVFVASRLPKSDRLFTIWTGIKPLFWGFILSAIFMLGIDIFLAGNKVSLLVYFSIWASSIIIIGIFLKMRNWVSNPSLTLFGLGFYIVLSLTGSISSVAKGHNEGLVIGVLFFISFLIAVIRIKRRFRPSLSTA